MIINKYLYFSLFYFRLNALVVIENQGKLNDYLEDVSRLNSKTHPAGYFVVVHTNGRTHFAVNKLLEVLQQKLLQKTVVINTGDDLEYFSYEINTLNKYLGYVKIIYIFASSTEDVTEVIKILTNLKIGNTRTRILIIFETDQNEKQIQEMFQRFWSAFYLNVSLIRLHENDFFVFTFNPFWNENITVENVSMTNIFYDKLKNLNRKKFKLLLLRHDDFSKQTYVKLPDGGRYVFGPEISIFRTLAAHINGVIEIKLSDKYLLPNERNPWRNGNFDTDRALDIKLRIIKEGGFDCLTSEEMIQADDLRGATESLYPHANDDMLIIMRKGRPLPHYQYIKFIFNIEVWYSFLSVLIISTISWLFISKSNINKVVIKFINLIRMLTGGSMDVLPTVLSERIFIIIWIFYSLIIITAFTSKLASTFMEIKYEPNIDTLDELNEKGYVLYGYKTQIKHLQDAYNGTSKFGFYKRMKTVPDKYDHVNPEDNDYVEYLHVFIQQHPAVLNRGRAELLAKIRVIKSIIHTVKESPLPNYVAFQVPVGSPYYDKMNLIIRKLIESGIYSSWLSMHEFLVIRQYIKCSKDICINIEKMTPLSLRHFQAAFIILCFGLISSLVAFLFEIVFFKITKRNKF